MNGEDVTDHIARVLEITEWIKIPNVEKNEPRLHVFSKSLSRDAEEWWNDEIEGKAIGWNETCNTFCHKYYFLSHSSNSKEIDKNTQNELWEFYVNERTKGAMGDLDDEPHNESYKKECSDTFYKPYLDTQDAKDIYKIIDREYTLIPIPAPRNIDNPDELCRIKEFTVVRHSIGNDEEFVTVSPSKIYAVERTPGSMSCIYHKLFSRKDRGWEVTRTKLAKAQIARMSSNFSAGPCLIMESLVKKKQKGAILELKRRHLKNTIFCTYTPYPAMKIRRISASSAQETRNDQFPIRRIHYNQYAVCTAVKMDDPNITMEEYIGLKEEKAQNMVRCITGKLLLIMESLVKKKQKGAILELKRRHLKNTIFCTYTPYPAMKIRRISASSAQETRNDQFPIRRLRKKYRLSLKNDMPPRDKQPLH
ncbi:hypothetical protein Tco_1404451 [Tanacetum coccineum]